jgi:hypothetical protein
MYQAEFLVPSFEPQRLGKPAVVVPMQMNIKVRSQNPRPSTLGRGTLRVRTGHPPSQSLIDFGAPNTATWDAGSGRVPCGFCHCAKGRGFLYLRSESGPNWLMLKAGSTGNVVKVKTYAVGEMAPQWRRHKRQNPLPSRAWTGYPARLRQEVSISGSTLFFMLKLRIRRIAKSVIWAMNAALLSRTTSRKVPVRDGKKL